MTDMHRLQPDVLRHNRRWVVCHALHNMVLVVGVLCVYTVTTSCCTHSEDETTSAVNTMRITFDNEYPSDSLIVCV